MSRQIKFRGKRIDNGEWIVGDLVHTTKDTLILPIDGGWNQYAVNSDSIGQFTGLHDKNGKEIYEGDIIRYIGNYDGDEFDSIVKYDVACFEPLYSSFIITAYDEESWILEVIPRIIGNIHDNPDL